MEVSVSLDLLVSLRRECLVTDRNRLALVFGDPFSI